jgi:hypothetical protein
VTRLEAYQRGLLDLIKGRGDPPADPYLQRVAGSAELAVVREIALWWRAFQIEAQCRLSSRLLKRLGCFETRVAAYFDGNATSPFIEVLSRGFLRSLDAHDDRLVRAVTQFEFALLEVRSGSDQVFEIDWDRHPDVVLVALDRGSELPAAEPEFLYRMRIDRESPGAIACSRERRFPAR